jgi:uncharacterized membrane protein YcaP (DUF421 family)
MTSVARGLAVYFFLLVIFRVAGKRSLTEVTTFDFVLLLIISETTQQAMIGEDFSVTGSFILIGTLVGADLLMSLLKQKFQTLDYALDGTPLILVDNGRLLKDRMDRERVDESDILEAARELQGLERMDQIKYAVLERSGRITIVPKEG